MDGYKDVGTTRHSSHGFANFPASTYQLKNNNRNFITRCKICSKLKKTPGRPILGYTTLKTFCKSSSGKPVNSQP